MRQLATRLAISGIHSLRFDYYGTGDSAGTELEVDPAACETDVESAMEALADIAGTTRLTLIGLRAGANIAAHVAARRLADVEALVLWDPILSENLQSLAKALPEHTGIFITDGEQSSATLRKMGYAVEFVPTQCPWLESATIGGMLPVAVIQRIVEWLHQ